MAANLVDGVAVEKRRRREAGRPQRASERELLADVATTSNCFGRLSDGLLSGHWSASDGGRTL